MSSPPPAMSPISVTSDASLISSPATPPSNSPLISHIDKNFPAMSENVNNPRHKRNASKQATTDLIGPSTIKKIRWHEDVEGGLSSPSPPNVLSGRPSGSSRIPTALPPRTPTRLLQPWRQISHPQSMPVLRRQRSLDVNISVRQPFVHPQEQPTIRCVSPTPSPPAAAAPDMMPDSPLANVDIFATDRLFRPEATVPVVLPDEDFVVHLLLGKTHFPHEMQQAYGAVLYSDVASFSELLAHFSRTAGIKMDDVVLVASYQVTSKSSREFFRGEFVGVMRLGATSSAMDLSGGVGIEVDGGEHGQEGGSGARDGMGMVMSEVDPAPWVSRYLQDQRGYNAVVYDARNASKRFQGLRIRAWTAVRGEAEWAFRVKRLG